MDVVKVAVVDDLCDDVGGLDLPDEGHFLDAALDGVELLGGGVGQLDRHTVPR